MNIWSNVPIDDHGTRKIDQQREKIAVASFTIINLLVAPRSGLFFSSFLKGLSEGPARCHGSKALRGSLGYLRVQISGRASSKVKAAYSTRVNEERGARRKRNRRQRTSRMGRMGDNKKKRE